jgi:IS605 OrfB family transposase
VNHFQLRDKLVTENTKKNTTEYKIFLEELSVLQTTKKTLTHMLKSYVVDSPDYHRCIEKLKQQEQCIVDKKKSRNAMCKQLKAEKTMGIQDWELNTPKAVRDAAIGDICKAYKTGFTNLKLGNVKHFRMHFKQKSNPNQCVCVPKSLVKIHDGAIELSRHFFKDDYRVVMGKKIKKRYPHLVIEHDTRIIKQKGDYWLIVPISTRESPIVTPTSYCGVDPGVRTFMTTFGNNGGTEYKHNSQLLTALNDKIKKIKKLRTSKHRKRVCKKVYNKIENRKSHLIDELHWKVITHLVDENDVIFYGDIKSHDIVKNNKNRTLNSNMNDLKFYKFKERLLFKATERNKRVILVNEAYTSQTCSCCGGMYKPGCSKIYSCNKCNSVMDRDMNASKNILMKGIMCL